MIRQGLIPSYGDRHRLLIVALDLEQVVSPCPDGASCYAPGYELQISFYLFWYNFDNTMIKH